MLNNDNVVKLIDYIESSTSCYVVMEYCDGGDLESFFLLFFYKTPLLGLLKKINHFSEYDGLEHFKEILNGFKVYFYL